MTNHNGDVVSYTYDRYGNKISMTYPDGSTVSSAQGTVLCAQEKPMKG
ncbi:MAG: RHS repeat protein [Clostridia bacterium]|nr:RHS repeat protein [Clostridia bacterium]